MTFMIRALLFGFCWMWSCAVLSAQETGQSQTDPRATGVAGLVLNAPGSISDMAARLTVGDRLRDGPVILHLWATWCAPCRRELPALAAYRAHLAKKGLSDRLLVVSVDTKPMGEIMRFLGEDLGLVGFQTFQADPRLVAALLKPSGYPSTFVVNEYGRVEDAHSGPVQWSEQNVRDRYEHLLVE